MFSFGMTFATEKKNQAYICNIVQKVGSAAEDDYICHEFCLVLSI